MIMSQGREQESDNDRTIADQTTENTAPKGLSVDEDAKTRVEYDPVKLNVDSTLVESAMEHRDNLQDGERTIVDTIDSEKTIADLSELINKSPGVEITETRQSQLDYQKNDATFISQGDFVVGLTNPGVTIGDQQQGQSKKKSTESATTDGSKIGKSNLSDQTTEFDHSRKAKPDVTAGQTQKNSIGRFEIIKILGEGAFGKVYLAKDIRLDRELAIKIAKTGVLNAKEDVDRFQREARAAARLRHPNIVPVHEAGSLGESNYIAYDFVRGTTIKQILKEKQQFAPLECVQILVKIVEAIHYAHEQGIIHRDIKPENIIVDERNEPHVLDFGLARGTDLDVTHTREGAMMGSPAYMSPEQASGMSHIADQRSDIWSLGVMMYEMLAGQRPFQGNITEVIIRVKSKEAPPLRSFVPNVDMDLVTICEKCLRKKSDERFASAGDMAEELHRWLRGEPIVSRPLSLLSKTSRWAKRNPTVALLIGVVCLSLIMGTITSSYFAYEAIKGKRLVIQTRKERDLAQVDNLVNGAPALFAQVIEILKPYASDVTPNLKNVLNNEKSSATQKLRSKTALLLLQPEEKLSESEACHLICQEYLALKPDEILPLREYLTTSLMGYKNHFWQEVLNENTEPKRRFVASAFLAALDQNPDRWGEIALDVVGQLLSKNSLEIHDWNKIFAPVKESLLSSLQQKFSTAETERERITAATVLADLFPENLELISNLLIRGNSSQFPSLMEPLEEKPEQAAALFKLIINQPLEEGAGELRIAELLRQKGNAVCALISLGKYDWVRPHLKVNSDPRILTHVIHQISSCWVNSEKIKEALEHEQDAELVASLLAIISQYGSDSLLESDRRKMLPRLEQLFKNQQSPGVISHLEYLLHTWKFEEQLALWQEYREDSLIKSNQENIGCFKNSRQQSFAVFPKERKFTRGSPNSELGHAIGDIETQYEVLIPRSFAISTHEVTVADYLQFQPEFTYEKEYSPLPQCPVHSVSWVDAAKYCRWLSEQEKIPEAEMCYPQAEKISNDMELPANILERTGYRLPTSSEWEFACRGGSTQSRCYGDDPQLLTKYAWFNSNGEYRSHPVGAHLPNAYGIFDMHGNILEWTLSYYSDDLPKGARTGQVIDAYNLSSGSERELRGGHFESPPLQVRAADREYDLESITSFYIGFRIAKTVK